MLTLSYRRDTKSFYNLDNELTEMINLHRESRDKWTDEEHIKTQITNNKLNKYTYGKLKFERVDVCKRQWKARWNVITKCKWASVIWHYRQGALISHQTKVNFPNMYILGHCPLAEVNSIRNLGVFPSSATALCLSGQSKWGSFPIRIYSE
jgi:hypothetical protein